LTKQDEYCPIVLPSESEAGAPGIETATDAAPRNGRADTVREVARMVAEWETGDELPTEFAERVVTYLEGRLS
jgi:hypothetical protein